ncbi:unnamed protein product [Cercospora beticola]|nr:unnamed protein product [Cercospora beticola]
MRRCFLHAFREALLVGGNVSHVHMGNELLEKKSGRVALVEHFGIGHEGAASTHFGRSLMMNESDTRWALRRSLVTDSADLGVIERVNLWNYSLGLASLSMAQQPRIFELQRLMKKRKRAGNGW